jgi:hypothetical protein
MSDFFYWGGPVYCSTAKKIVWERPTEVLCKPLEGSSNNAFYHTLGPDPIAKLLSKAGVTERGSIGFGGFSAFHGFLSPLLDKFSDQVDYVHLADACFQGAGATTAKSSYVKFGRRAIAGQARMTVTTNGPWDKDIHYWGPKGSKYDGVKFSLTSGAKCFHNVWKELTGDAAQTSVELPAGVPQPDRTFRKGELYWFHYEGTGQKDPHGWHVNELATPYIQKYGVPWMAGHRGVLGGAGAGKAAVVGGLALLAALSVGGYIWARRRGYVPNASDDRFPKRCKRCGRVYDTWTWSKIPRRGFQKWPWGEVHEYRNCPCGTTLSVVHRRDA